MTDVVVECRDTWKVFGKRPQDALKSIREEGLDKDEAFRRFNCVVGVAGVSFSVRRGEIFCVMGLSGSGKSTLVRHVNRLIEPTAGEILVDGQDIGRMSARELRRMRAEKIGMVFQNMALLPHRSVRDNVALSLELRNVARHERIRVAEEKLELVQLGGWGQRYPDELSGGMQQRVGLARALAADPDVLLMDEPFSALDPLIRRDLQRQFLDLSRTMHKTTLFITHDLDEAIRLGDRIAIMKDGRIVQVGTPEKIVTEPADDYVADFVQGISRLKLVRAGSVMSPVDPEATLDGLPRARIDADLDQLIDLSNRSNNRPILILGEDGRPAGIISTSQLLHSIQGTGNTAPDTDGCTDPIPADARRELP